MSSYKQAQESILGAILVDSKNVMPLVADKLTAENFINPECERVFAAFPRAKTHRRDNSA